MAALPLTCLCSLETNLTLICPSPKLFVCYLPDSGRHVSRPNQRLLTSRRENLGTRLVLNMTCYLYPWVSFWVKQSILGLVEKRSMWRNVRTVGKSGGSCTFPSHKGETKFLKLLGAFYLTCLNDVKFYSFADFVHLPRVGEVVNSLCPSTEENCSS